MSSWHEQLAGKTRRLISREGQGLTAPLALFLCLNFLECHTPEPQFPRISLLGNPVNRGNGHPLVVGRRKLSNSNFNSFMWCTDRAATLHAATKREARPPKGPALRFRGFKPLGSTSLCCWLSTPVRPPARTRCHSQARTRSPGQRTRSRHPRRRTARRPVGW